MTGFEKVNRFGKARTNDWNKLPESTKPVLTDGEGRILNISQDIRSGSPQETWDIPKILKQITEVTYKLDLPHHPHIAPSFHVSQIKQFSMVL